MRDTTQLHPILQQKIKELIKLCNDKDLKIGISECLRTKEEQDNLYAKGRTQPGSIVTNAKGSTYSSMHQWGIAFDFYRNDGKSAYNDEDGFFTKVGIIGQSLGLEWGGAWKSIIDKPHFQLPNWGSTPTKLKILYTNPYRFFDTWEEFVLGKYSTKKSLNLLTYGKNTPLEKVPYFRLTSNQKKKCEKGSSGYAKIKAGQTIKIIEIEKTEGCILGKLNSGYWIILKDNEKVNVETI